MVPTYYAESGTDGKRREVVLYRMEKLIKEEDRECYAWDEEPLLIQQPHYDVILQRFLGKALIPSDVWCVPADKKEAFEEYAKTQTMTGKEEFFLQNGKLTITFEIRVKSNQDKWYFFETGDVICYDLGKSIADDYEVGGME